MVFEIKTPQWFPWHRPRLNFITLHYVYIFGMTILGSIFMYPIKNLSYADALFFSAGACTQSGLNTIDVNLLKTYQQIVITALSWLCNPITINTAVVYIRLYWFEKRFQSIVEQSRSLVVERRTMSRDSRRKSEGEIDRVERGVGGRTITVLLNSARRSGPNAAAPDRPDETPDTKELQEFRKNVANGDIGPFRPIKFGGGHQRSRSDANHRLAMRQSRPGQHDQTEEYDNEYAIEDEEEMDPNTRLTIPEAKPEDTISQQHITFADPVMMKPKRKDSEVFVVPSPFDVETRGSVPHRLQLNEDEEETSPPAESPTVPFRRAITIEEPTNGHPNSGMGPRHRIRTAPTDKTDHSNDHGPISPGFVRAFSDAIRGRRNSTSSKKSGRTVDRLPYLSYVPTVGRNSQFHIAELTDDQKEELGGVEYRSLKLLSWILVGYFMFFQVFGILCLVPWIWTRDGYGSIVTGVGQGRTWWGIFTASSAFTDLGFTLTPDSMSSFNTATWPLLAMSYLIVIGNTGFPCMLRFTIWALWKIWPNNTVAKESLHFLLDHPRRCFTLLFPSKATWWLFVVLVGLNFTDLLLFIILDLNNPGITQYPASVRVLDAFFQAISTRTAGFSSVNLAILHPAVQVSYMVMMYISVFPIAISVRRTNVYEERSLGIYGNPREEMENPDEQSFVGAHLRKQLSFDLWYVFLGLFCVCVAEASKISNRNDYAFTQFSCLFEVVSAYGTVGLSLGYPNINASFSSQFTTFSKIVIMAMMIRGRHRGLPYELDRAILLPSENLQAKEEEEINLRLQRRQDTLERMERRSLRPMSGISTQENGRNAWLETHTSAPAGLGGFGNSNGHLRTD